MLLGLAHSMMGRLEKWSKDVIRKKKDVIRSFCWDKGGTGFDMPCYRSSQAYQ